jgi:hypothetical protein
VNAESAIGIKSGAKTGLSSVVCGILYAATIFCYPIWSFIPAAGVLAASSPRLVGEAAYYAGKAGGAIGNTGSYARKAGSYAGNKINALSGGRIGKAANYAGGKINSLAGMTPEMLKNIQMYNTMHQVQNAGNQQQ